MVKKLDYISVSTKYQGLTDEQTDISSERWFYSLLALNLTVF